MSVLSDDRRRLSLSEQIPERKNDTRPAAGIAAAVIVLGDLRGDVGLQGERAEVVADQAADGELALFQIADDRSVQIRGPVGDGAELPFADRLGRRQVDIEEIRVAALESKWGGTRRDLRPARYWQT